MSRWGKNIVVPLDSLCKEKENTNRPTVARSVGTVGKWGKMGFTSTRTYTLSALPAAVAAAAAAAAAAASPAQSPASAAPDDDLSPSVPEPPKPKKFFKSRNTAPPEVIAQIIQNLPRSATSPMRDGAGGTSYLSSPIHGREPIKMKFNKSNSAERKKKSPKKSTKVAKSAAVASMATGDDTELDGATPKTPTSTELKPKKKKEEKKLKPEAPPSRVISRARKTVNYCEDDEERMPTPIKDIILPKRKPDDIESTVPPTPASTAVVDVPPSTSPTAIAPANEPVLPPPAAPPMASPAVAALPAAIAVNIAPKTPEHPPIVLRISKGTSRLVSTDSEEQAANAASPLQLTDTEQPLTTNSRHASTEEVPSTTPIVLQTTPKIIVKPPRPPSPASLPPPPTPLLNDDEPPEINYCTVKISPDKPPKERLKLIIKTDVIRNAMAAAAKAAAAERAAEAAALAGVDGEQRPEREKKQKNKKHKHPKHSIVEQLTPAAGSEFKTPSPHLAVGTSGEQLQHARTVISPPALSERDFDSQSSVLGSISSKGNSTPLAQAVHEESCVIHSRGSSVITSDLETSQHSSLVAPPSDIESRLESMMMDGEVSQQRTTNLIEDPPEELQTDDILAVLRGEESQVAPELNVPSEQLKLNGAVENLAQSITVTETEPESPNKRRVTRGRGRNAVKTNYAEDDEEVEALSQPPQMQSVQKQPQAPARTRGRKPAATIVPPQLAEEAPPTPTVNKRASRRGSKKVDEFATASMPMEVDECGAVEEKATSSSPNKSEEENTPMQPTTVAPAATRRGRPPRNANSNNNNLSSNNNNINKIAANLTAKAGAAEEAAATTKSTEATNISPSVVSGTDNNETTPPVTTTPRSYGGRKRKNQQVTQVLQPTTADDLQQPRPAKQANIDLPPATAATEASTTPTPNTVSSSRQTPTSDLLLHDDHDANSNNSNSLGRPLSATPLSPPRRDYKIKDKFKRTLMLDNNQVNCNAVLSASPTNAAAAADAAVNAADDETQPRGVVKLVISKKKGSIFKSRALIAAAQTEQPTATAGKRHLYKHRWDAEANGGMTPNDAAAATAGANAAKSNDLHPTAATALSRTTADDIFDDFSEDLSGGAHSRDNSPLLNKLTRVIKTNPQAPQHHNPFEMDTDSGVPCDSSTITSIKIDRKAKEYYTVVRNVKTAHQIQEIGEFQEMDDDVEYILDALQPHNPTATRCLSALQLATKCMTPAFRMHVRAHGVVTKFFKALSDSNTDLSLGLCTSAIMYILSQEGLNMDLDRDSLELMMNLLEAEGVAAPSDRANYERNRQKVRDLCEEIKAQGKATHLNVDSITVGTLAMETLLSLTSKRAGEWFKEELRELGGLEHIIKTISDCCRPVIETSAATSIDWTQSLLDNMQTVARCMRVLENVTQMNEENQKYMLTYAKGTAVSTLCTLYRLCDRELTLYPATMELNTKKENPGTVLRELLLPVMKVLINLTHTFNPATSLGAELLGQRSDVIETSFHLLLQAPQYIPDRCVFELSILVLLLLINLTMHTHSNRMLIMKAYSPSDNGAHQQHKVTAVQAVLEYFYKCEELARLVEKNTDAILDNSDKNKKKQEEVDETVNNLLQKAGHHMEHTLKGSYAGIFIGHLITDNEENEATIRTHLRGNGFKEIVSVLEKYYTFMNLTASSESSVVAHIKATKKLIDYFKKRDLVYEMNEANDCPLPLNLETHHGSASTTTAAYSSTPSPPATTATTTTASSSATTRGTQRVYKTYSQR